MGPEARIRLGIDGTNEVRNAFRMIKADSLTVEGVIKSVAAGFVRFAGDVAKAGTGMKAIDFSGAVDRAKEFETTLTKLSMRGGKNLDDLRIRFVDLGKQTGMGSMKFAEAVKAYDKQNFVGLDEASEAVRVLSADADDTGRSLEEMLSAGSEAFSKLGVNVARFRDELGQVRTIAADTRIAGGFQALEDSVKRLLPLMAKLQGGQVRGGAAVGALQERGYSKQVSEELYERIFGAFGNEQQTHLIRRAAKTAGFKGDVYVKDATGRPVLSTGALKALQKYTANKSFWGVANFFGGGAMGEEAARLFRDPKFLERVDQLTADAEGKQAVARKVKGALDTGRGFLKQVGLNLAEGSIYGSTEAGQQEKRDAERSEYEQGLGKKLLDARQRREKSMSAEDRAKIDTAVSYGPSWAQDAWAIGAYGYYTGGDENYRGVRMGPGIDYSYKAPAGAPAPSSSGWDPRGSGKDEFLDALKKLPAAIVDGLKKADIKVRSNPLGAAQEAARTSG